MSSVLIKGLIMPKNCRNCKFSYSTNYIEMKCLFVDEACKIHGRLPNCPLVEIPSPHGRLIDADELLNIITSNDYTLVARHSTTDKGMFTIGIKQAISEAQTIIDAEVSE